MGKLIGGILLIVGTTIGGGMLALPVATAASGFFNSTLLMIACWMAMTFCAFLILEVNMWLPQQSNMISMAKVTLGKWGQAVAWLTYLLLLYSLLSAYIASGTDIVHSLSSKVYSHMPVWAASVIFVLLLGAIVYKGIRSIDYVNRGLMFTKLLAYVLLVTLTLPHVNLTTLPAGNTKFLLGTVTVVITSFGFATIIPSLRSYFKDDIKKLRLVILTGSLIPLFCYILWNFAIQGVVPSEGSQGLIQMGSSNHTVTELAHALISIVNSSWVTSFTNLFTSICVATSFLGVALCLSDFLADGLNIPKEGKGNLIIQGLTFAPPLAVILFYPGAFIMGLKYAGLFCIILLMLLPALMVWSGRYRKKIAQGYQVFGGKPILIIVLLASIAVIVLERTYG